MAETFNPDSRTVVNGPTSTNRPAEYQQTLRRLDALLEGETDWVAAMATVASELHHAFDHFHWTGFYRAVADGALIIGPYQGTHGCLRIPGGRGACGAAASTKKTQRIADVSTFEGHIACSATTRSEIVVPIVNADGMLLGVLDVDSDYPDAFDQTDQHFLEKFCDDLGRRFG